MFKELELSETDSVLAAYNAVCDLVEEMERLQAACAAKEAELAELREQTAELFGARLEAEGIGEEAVTAAKAMWQRDPQSVAMATLGCDIVNAANPYGCNQYGEGWVRPHNGMQTMKRRKDGTPAPDISEIDNIKIDDDDDSPEATERRKQKLDLHKRFAEEMQKRLKEWFGRRDDKVKAAAGTEDDKRPFPVQMPDGSMCHTYGCEKHKGADEIALKEADKKLDELMRQAMEAYEKGQMTKVEKLMEEHATWRSYAEKLMDFFGLRKEEKSIKRYFEPAKTREEAIRNTNSLIDGKGRVRWGSSISVQQINEFNEVIAEMKEKYPLKTKIVQLGSYIGKKDEEGAHCEAWTKPNEEDIVLHLELNQDHEYGGVHDFYSWKPYERWEVKQSGGYNRMNVGASKSGISIRAVMLHEYGHALHVRANIAVAYSDKTNASWIKDNVNVGNKWKEVYATAINNGDIVKISEYAADNDSEFFAECFAARELGEKLPDYINSALDNVIELAIKKP